MFMWKFGVLHKHGNSSAPPHEKKNICFCCLPVFMCIIRRSSRSNLSLLHHWCIICLWILGYVRLELIQNSCELLVHRQWSNTGDLLQFICLCIYMFFVVWIFIPFLCFKSKSGCITPEQQHKKIFTQIINATRDHHDKVWVCFQSPPCSSVFFMTRFCCGERLAWTFGAIESWNGANLWVKWGFPEMVVPNNHGFSH